MMVSPLKGSTRYMPGSVNVKALSRGIAAKRVWLALNTSSLSSCLTPLGTSMSSTRKMANSSANPTRATKSCVKDLESCAEATVETKARKVIMIIRMILLFNW